MTFEQGAAAGPGWGRGLPGTLGEGRAGTARGGPWAGAEPGPGPGYGREPQLWEGAPAMGESPTNRGKSVEWESLQLFLFPSLSPPPCSQGHFSPSHTRTKCYSSFVAWLLCIPTAPLHSPRDSLALLCAGSPYTRAAGSTGVAPLGIWQVTLCWQCSGSLLGFLQLQWEVSAPAVSLPPAPQDPSVLGWAEGAQAGSRAQWGAHGTGEHPPGPVQAVWAHPCS